MSSLAHTHATPDKDDLCSECFAEDLFETYFAVSLVFVWQLKLLRLKKAGHTLDYKNQSLPSNHTFHHCSLSKHTHTDTMLFLGSVRMRQR